MRLTLLILFFVTSIGLKHTEKPHPKTTLKNMVLMENRISELSVDHQIEYYIKKYSMKYEVPKNIILAVIEIESGYGNHNNYNPHVISSVGALGPMQVMLTTARDIMNNPKITKDELLNNIELNINCGVKYLSMMYNIYNNWELTLISYNAGPSRANKLKFAYENGNQNQYLHTLPKETQNYIRKSRSILF